jgi:hypothetical protein
MDPIDWKGLQDQILSSATITEEELEEALERYDSKRPAQNITCNFYFPRCTTTEFREKPVIDLMLSKLIAYVLQQPEYQNASHTRFRAIYLEAKETFVATPNSGEAGELLLFLFLESNGIIQVYSKMGLKTNPNMHFHGYDAVHVQVHSEFVLHYGHAKMYASFANALANSLSDVEEMAKNSVQRDLEIRLASKHTDAAKFGTYAQTVRDMLNPYYKYKEKYREVNSLFLGANEDFMSVPNSDANLTFEGMMKQRYEKRREDISEQIKKGVDGRRSINHQVFNFYILPFVDVDDFRKKFLAELKR